MVVLSERSEPKDLSQMHNKPHIAPKPFSFTHFPKNASANPLESHSFKTKDLKPFRFTHFQKKVGWTPCFPPDAHLQSPVYPEAGRVTNHKSLRLSPLISALTSKRASKSFTSNTYEKHTGGEGGGLPGGPYFPEGPSPNARE
jgi:hypothetical protein